MFRVAVSLSRQSLWNLNRTDNWIGSDLCWHLVHLGILDVGFLDKICWHLVYLWVLKVCIEQVEYPPPPIYLII